MMLHELKQLPLREEDALFIEAIEEQAQQKEMKIGVFGSFSVGKSALINALIGNAELLPTHTNETTAVPTYILGADEDRIEVFKFNGEINIINSIQMHSLKAGAEVNEIEKINVYQSTPSWLKEITLIDTPGRNTKFQAHIEASEQALVTSDAVLYVMPWQGLTLEDIVYIKHILRYQPNLYFVINKVDRIDEVQGITIEQLQQRVAADLQEQLGKRYPVYAVSATTGFNIDQLYTEFLIPLKKEIEQLKQSRFRYAVQQFLQREQERLMQKIQLFEQATMADSKNLKAQKQALQLKYEQVNIDVANNIEEVRNTLHTAEQELQAYIQVSYSGLEVQLKNLTKSNLSVEQLSLKAQDLIVTTRNEVFEMLQGRIRKIVGEEVSLEIHQLENSSVQINITQPNLAHLQEQYELERNKVIAKLANAQQQLASLPNDEGNEQQRARLIEEIEQLTEHALEQFVPQYTVDESFDPNKAKKIASAIGFVGDMALTVGLAIVTSGGSAAAQVGGKVAAKEATKTAAKTTAKEAAKVAARRKAMQEITEKAIIAGAQLSTAKNDKLLKAAQALDKFTSPVQTVATKIGESIDATRSQSVQEDAQYRRDFFARKYELESERDIKMQQLTELEQRAQTNEKIRQEVTQKRAQIERAAQQKIEQLEQNYQKDLQQAHENHINSQIEAQLQHILSEEEQQLNDWFKTEFATILNTVEKMLPQQLQQDLQSWEQQIQHVEQLRAQDATKVTEELAVLQQRLQVIESMLLGEINAVSV